MDPRDVLGRLRREFPLPVQVVEQQLVIDDLRAEVARLKAELARRDQPTRLSGGSLFTTVPGDAAQTVKFTRPPSS